MIGGRSCNVKCIYIYIHYIVMCIISYMHIMYVAELMNVRAVGEVWGVSTERVIKDFVEA